MWNQTQQFVYSVYEKNFYLSILCMKKIHVVYDIFWLLFFVHFMYDIKSDLNFFYILYNKFHILQ